MRFLVALHSDNGTHYGVTVPNLPGYFSAGDTYEEAIQMASEGKRAHIEHSQERPTVAAKPMRS